MEQRRYLPKRVKDLNMWQHDQLCDFLSQQKVDELYRTGEDVRPLIRLMKEEYDLARQKGASLPKLLAHCNDALRKGKRLDATDPQYLRFYVRARMCWHVNYHFMRPKPYPLIRIQAIEQSFGDNEWKPKLGLFRLVEGRGNPDFKPKSTIKDVVALANRLVRGEGREKYRVRRYYRRDVNVCYPHALKKEIAHQLGISTRSVDRKLLEGGWEMPDDLVYRVS